MKQQVLDVVKTHLEHFLFSHILGIIIPTHFNIFQRGGYRLSTGMELYAQMLHVWNIYLHLS